MNNDVKNKSGNRILFT